MNSLEQTLEYHHRSVHHFGRYARSVGFMDWDSQPDPFRVFEGAPRTPLEVIAPGDGPRLEEALREGAIPPATLGPHSIGQLLGDSLGLTAWKRSGMARWALRANPSSGNLHPTEGYLIAGEEAGFEGAPAVWHYQPLLHVLERRAGLPEARRDELASCLPAGTAFVGLSTIHLRESWKYGERAFRYCHLDLGHAIAAVAYAAAGLGWRCRLLEGATDSELASLLGLAEAGGLDAEHPDTLLALYAKGAPEDGRVLPPTGLFDVASVEWCGEPNSLAETHEPWPAIDGVYAATVKRERPSAGSFEHAPPAIALETSCRGDLRRLIHQRRSAVEMDGSTSIGRDDFFALLAGTLPGEGRVPFAAFPWRPRVHLALFVHRVDGLAPGLYALVRSEGALETLRATMNDELRWEKPAACPEALPLYLLKESDCRALAADLSCGQSIASQGAFACAMLAELESSLAEFGPWFYRRLYWEAGAIGQALYLGAEAIGVRGTGIGCFFDDETHRALGVKDERLRDLYHFTVGGPQDDPRLETLPPYGHLEGLGEERRG